MCIRDSVNALQNDTSSAGSTAPSTPPASTRGAQPKPVGALMNIDEDNAWGPEGDWWEHAEWSEVSDGKWRCACLPKAAQNNYIGGFHYDGEYGEFAEVMMDSGSATMACPPEFAKDWA
eukprot:3576401-Alexandrium_andersonii.AAC.1